MEREKMACLSLCNAIRSPASCRTTVSRFVNEILFPDCNNKRKFRAVSMYVSASAPPRPSSRVSVAVSSSARDGRPPPSLRDGTRGGPRTVIRRIISARVRRGCATKKKRGATHVFLAFPMSFRGACSPSTSENRQPRLSRFDQHPDPAPHLAQHAREPGALAGEIVVLARLRVPLFGVVERPDCWITLLVSLRLRDGLRKAVVSTLTSGEMERLALTSVSRF